MNNQPPDLNILRHDMRGCINAIRLSVEVLKLPGSDGDFATFLECIENELARVEVLLAQLTAPPVERAAA